MSTYVLVHGAWFGSWCWDKVVRRRLLLVVASTLTAFAAAGIVFTASASAGCGQTSLQGGYGYHLAGSLYAAQEIADIAGAGRIQFDGHGAFTGAETDSFNGMIESVTYAGTYQVRSDCTGSAIIQNSNGRTDHINIVLVDDGRQIEFVDTDPGAVLAGSFRKQHVGEDRS